MVYIQNYITITRDLVANLLHMGTSFKTLNTKLIY